MDHIQSKFSKNLLSNDINELLETIITMRFNIKDEYEFMIYIRNYYLGIYFII